MNVSAPVIAMIQGITVKRHVMILVHVWMVSVSATMKQDLMQLDSGETDVLIFLVLDT